MKTRKKTRNLVAKFAARFHRVKAIDSKKRKAMVNRRQKHKIIEE